MNDLNLRELTDEEREEIKRAAACCTRRIYWSEEDRCFIGSLPDLCGECCHGDTPDSVNEQLTICAEMNLELEARMEETEPQSCRRAPMPAAPSPPPHF